MGSEDADGRGLEAQLGFRAFSLSALALFCAACGGSPVVLTAFRTEQQAQEHCPKDTIVWLIRRVACIN